MGQQPARIGVLIPQGNTIHEEEFERLRPQGVDFRFVGFSYPQNTHEFCTDVVPQMMPALETLRVWGADLVLVGCTTASMTCAGETFTRSLQAAAGVPIVTSADASLEAMTALGLTRISIATPYGPVNNGVVETFVSNASVKIVTLKGLDLDRSVETWVAGQATLTPDRVFDLCLAADRPEAQGLYLPCTGMGSLEAIERFEAASGKPAFSSIQAGYWASLRRLGIDGRQSGAGRLLRQWDFDRVPNIRP